MFVGTFSGSGGMTMLVTRKTRRTAKRFADVSLTDNDRFEADTVSPHDKDALKVFVENLATEERLPGLMRGAARSRDLYEVHRCAAWEAIRAARSAKQSGNGVAYRDHLRNANDARRRARECYRFARDCEDRANALIMAGCSPPPKMASTGESATPDETHALPQKVRP